MATILHSHSFKEVEFIEVIRFDFDSEYEYAIIKVGRASVVCLLVPP